MRVVKFVAAVVAASVTILAQNLPYGGSNYNSQSQPDLTDQTVETLNLSFPDCSNGPLSAYTICSILATYGPRYVSHLSGIIDKSNR